MIQVTPLQTCDIPGAITAIQEAFAEDPYNHWVYNDRSKLDLNRNRVSLGIRCRWGMRNALFHVAKEEGSEEVLGVAMWAPPRPAAKETWAEYADSWWLWLNQVGMNLWYGRGGLNVKRYYIWKDCQSKAQSQLWTDPAGYYFCNIVVAHPNSQGKGVGRALFKKVFEAADREGKKCYLESSRDIPNTAIYEKLGFKKVMQMDCDDDGEVCELFCMIREPRSSAS